MNSLGNWGEEKAARLLVGQGYVLVARNYRSRFGEIDLVVQKGNRLVAVEVKAREGRGFGFSAEAVTPAKLEKIKRTFMQFIEEREWAGECGVMVVALDGGHGVELIEDIWLS